MQEEIANLVHPVLAYGLRLRERLQHGEKPLLDVEQATLKGLLLSETEARRWVSFGGESDREAGVAEAGGGDLIHRSDHFLGIRYALVCWLDELFTLDSPWEKEWNERKLEVALYGTNDRAWKFWDQARRAETRPESDALEVFFLCVMLGFRGELREDAEQLLNWAAATQSRITKIRGQQWKGPAELDPPTRVPPRHGREKLQRMILTGGLMLLVLIPLMAFFIVQHLGN